MSESQNRESGRYPLAFDANGNPIKVPPNAVGWRVKRGGGRRGRPRSIFRDGHQLEIPIGASIEELIQAECPTDRYLLYPIDEAGVVIPGVVAVTEVPPGYEDGESPDPDDEEGGEGDGLVARLLTALERQSETLCKAVEHTTRGYDPVAAPEAPREVMLRQPSGEPVPQSSVADDKAKIEMLQQIMGMAAQVYSMFQNSRAPGGAATAAEAAPSGDPPSGGGPAGAGGP